MPGTSTPIFPQTIRNAATSFTNTDGTNIKTVLTGGTNGTKIEWLNIASTDTAAKDIQFSLSDGTTTFLISTLSIPATAGFVNSVLPISLLASATASPYLPYFQFPLDVNGNRYVYLANGWSLRANFTSAITAAKTATVVLSVGDF